MRKNKTVKLLIILLLGLSIIPIAIHPGRAQVAISGYAVTNFAAGFGSNGPPPSGIGPVGLGMDTHGNLYVGDIVTGNVYKFGPAGGVASSATQLATPSSLGGHFPHGLAFGKDGNLYVNLVDAGQVVQLDSNSGTIIRTVTSAVPGASALAADPLSGDLFVSQSGTGGACSFGPSSCIFRVSNFATGPGTVTVYASVPGADGLAFGPDGTLYAAAGGLGGAVKIAGTNSITPGTVTFIASVPSIDGMAVSAIPSTPFLYGNRNDGIITKIDLSTSQPTLTNVVSGGSRGDFATVGSDGCLYATQTDSVLKVTNADGSCIPPPLGPLFPTNPSPVVCVAPSSGLVSWWPGDGNANDIISGNQGSISGTVGFVPGEVNQAFSFTGAGEVIIPDSPSLNPATALTVDAWVKPVFAGRPTIQSDADIILSKVSPIAPFGVNDLSGYQLSILMDPTFFFAGTTGAPLGTVVISINIGGTLHSLPSTTAIPDDGRFHLVAGTYDGSIVKLFLDGTLVGEKSVSGNIVPSHGDALIGLRPFAPPVASRASIDEVEIYNRALIPSEVQSIFNAGSAGKCKAGIHVSEFFTDSSLNSLPLDSKGNPKVDVVLANGVVTSTNPGQVLAWVNVTNTAASSIQSLKLNETLPVDWAVNPAWMPALGGIHVFFANTTSLATNPEITQPSTITVSTANPETVHLAIANLTATNIGHPLKPGQSILLSVKLTYALIGTSQSATSYPRDYTDTATAAAWTQTSFNGSKFAGNVSAFFTAQAKVVS